MKTFSISLDDQLDTALEAVAAQQGREKAQVVADLVRKFVQAEQLANELRNPEMMKLYQELEAEDVALAEAGMADYQQLLKEADQL